VSRTEFKASSAQAGHIYSLHGPSRIADTHVVEERLRQSLLSALPKATFVLLRY